MNQNKVFAKEFCQECAISVKMERVYNNGESVDVDNLLILNSHCDRCVIHAGSGFKMIIDPEELRVGEKLKDEEDFIWDIKEIYNKLMVPAMFKIECKDLMANKYIKVSDLCDYELVGD